MTTAWHRHAAERLAQAGKTDPLTGVIIVPQREVRYVLGKFYHLDNKTQNAVIKEMEDAGLVCRRDRETLIVVPVARE